MKTEADVLDDMRKVLTYDALTTAISGQIYDDMRPTNSKKEDVFVRVKALDSEQVQTAIVSVHLYVAKKLRQGDKIRDKKRIRTLAPIIANRLNHYQDEAEGWHLSLTNQYVEDAADEDFSVIIHNIIYNHCNN
jgi:hypothetical protein